MGIYIGQQRLNYLWEKIKTIITNKEKVIAAALNDLNDKKANISSLSPVATSGSYNDLTDKPVIPNATVDSELDSDSENPVQNKVIDEALTEIKTDYVKKILATKSYSNIIGTANSFDGAAFFFATVVPTGWNNFWHIKYRIRAHVQGRSANDGEEWSVVEMCGSAANHYWSKIFNATKNTSVRPYYYHYLYRLTEAGFNAHYGHLIGVSLQSSYSPTSASYKRDFTIELLKADNCTFTFMDNMTLYSNVTGSGTTNYTGSNAFDAYTQGATITGDRNTTTNFSLSGGCWITAGANGIFAYTIIMADSSGTYQSVVLSRSTGTTKTKNSVGFDLTKPIYWYASSTDIASGNHTTAGLNIGYPGDIRYSCNCGSTLIQGKPFYFVMTQGNDGLFYLDDIWWTQTLPSTNDGKYYVYIGIAYGSYTVHMEIEKPIYYHNGTKIVKYIQGGGGSGEANVIEIIKVNGTALTPDSNKAVDITVPSAVTESTVSGWGFTKNAGTVYIQLGDNNGEFYLINKTYSEVLALVQAGEDVVLEYVNGPNNALKDYFYLVHNFNNGQSLVFVSERIGGIELFSNNTIEGAYIYRGIETIELNGNTYTPDEGLVDLGTISSGDENVIETIKVNNTALTPDANKAVNITIPAAPGTLNTTATTAQSTNSSEALSGNITLHKVAKTGTYSDLIGKPTIPAAVTESTVSGWGFTKNTGTYSKPSGGIPPTDLSSAVQTSLGKADTALQSYTETDPVFSASAAAGISSTDISNWNSKTSNVGTITGITMNGASKGTSGVVDLGTVITAHQSLSGKQDVINDLATIRSNASSGAAAATTIAGYGDIVTYNASEFQTKITVSSSSPSGGNDGDIWIVV